MTGAIGAAIWYGGFYILFKFCMINHILAALISAVAAFIFALISNRQWTFNAGEKNMALQFIKYGALISFTVLVSTAVLYIFTDILKIRAELSQIVAMGASAIMNFLGSKLWVFKQGDRALEIQNQGEN